MYRGNISKCMHKVDGGSTKEPADLTAALILGDLQHLYKGFLFYVSEPDLAPVGEDWDNYGNKDPLPLYV